MTKVVSVECCCSGARSFTGAWLALAAYWRLQFEARLVPTAFGLEEIAPTAEGVALDYLNLFEGKPVRLLFTFTPEGKIWQHQLRAARRGRCWHRGSASRALTKRIPASHKDACNRQLAFRPPQVTTQSSAQRVSRYPFCLISLSKGVTTPRGDFTI